MTLPLADTVEARSDTLEHNAVALQRYAPSHRMNAIVAALSETADQRLLSVPGRIQAKAFAALSLPPLVALAGAEGGVDDRERSLVLGWARDAGLRDGDAAYRLVEQWLEAPTGSELLATWRMHYVARLSLMLSREAKRGLKLEILDPYKRPVSATADSHEVRNVVEVRVRESRDRTVTLLFDPEHNLEERILDEQFVT